MTARYGERGSAAVELTLLTPMLLLLVLLVLLAGRVTGAQQVADQVAHDAARAASLERTAVEAEAAAQAIAQSTLATYGLRCRDAVLELDHGGLRPGGSVTAELTCEVGLEDLSGLGVPGGRSLSATSTVAVDTFRGTP